MNKWYLVCYLSTANGITIKSRHNTLEGAGDAMRSYEEQPNQISVFFIMESYA